MREWFVQQPSWARWTMLTAIGGAVQVPGGIIGLWVLQRAVKSDDIRDVAAATLVLLLVAGAIAFAVHFTPSASASVPRMPRGEMAALVMDADNPPLPPPDTVPRDEYDEAQDRLEQVRADYERSQAELAQRERELLDLRMEQRRVEQQAMQRFSGSQSEVVALKRAYTRLLRDQVQRFIATGQRFVETVERRETAEAAVFQAQLDAWAEEVDAWVAAYVEPLPDDDNRRLRMGMTTIPSVTGDRAPPDWDAERYGNHTEFRHKTIGRLSGLSKILAHIEGQSGVR